MIESRENHMLSLRKAKVDEIINLKRKALRTQLILEINPQNLSIPEEIRTMKFNSKVLILNLE
jgi:hypothetical protein